MKLLAAILAFSFLLGGCATDAALNDRTPTPKYFERATATGQNRVAAARNAAEWEREAIAKYHKATDVERDNMSQQVFRNSVIDRELAADDDDFNAFVQALRAEWASGNISADLATTILNGLSVVTGGVKTKRTLAVLSSAVTSGKASVQKELFNQEALTAITARMRAARLQALVPIEAGRNKSIADYSLEQGLRDLRRYAEAGTLVGAFTTITNDAGEAADEARNEITRITRGADYRATAVSRKTIFDAIDKLPDAQVLTLASTMLPHFPEREAAKKSLINSIHPEAARLASPAAAKRFLLFWLLQEDTPDQLSQWADALEKAKQGGGGG